MTSRSLKGERRRSTIALSRDRELPPAKRPRQRHRAVSCNSEARPSVKKTDRPLFSNTINVTWRWRQSSANPSPSRYSLFRGKIQGNFGV